MNIRLCHQLQISLYCCKISKRHRLQSKKTTTTPSKKYNKHSSSPKHRLDIGSELWHIRSGYVNADPYRIMQMRVLSFSHIPCAKESSETLRSFAYPFPTKDLNRDCLVGKWLLNGSHNGMYG